LTLSEESLLLRNVAEVWYGALFNLSWNHYGKDFWIVLDELKSIAWITELKNQIFLLLCCVGIKYIYLNSPPPWLFFIPSPSPEIVSNRYQFTFIYICTKYVHQVHPPPFPCHLPTPSGTNPPSLGRTCSTLLSSDFMEEKRNKEKNDIFYCLR
jgi:hypothetical protein